MTCIVGLEHEGQVWIGGDSAGVAGLGITVRRDRKVFINDEYLMGFTTSFRMGQLLQYGLTPPERSTRVTDDMEWLVTGFVDAVRDLFKEKGYMGEDDESREDGGTWLLGYRGTLYSIHADFQVGSSYDGYDAVGCGEDYALGSLHSTANLGLAPDTRIRLALDAASHHNAGVRPPYTILNV